GPARGDARDPRRDEEDSRGHPVRQVRQGLDAGEPRQPDLVQGDARQVRQSPDRAGRREAARYDAVDQAAGTGRQEPELTRVPAPDIGSAPLPRPPAVALADVAVSFRLGDGGSYPAVGKTSLAVADGEFVAIVGPTGCGKSTLLNLAAGLLQPSA